MTTHDSDRPEPTAAPKDTLLRELTRVEHVLRAGEQPSEEDMLRLEQSAADAPRAADRYHRRLAGAFALYELRARDMPGGALTGLYDDVRAALDEPWGRARMSTAFLDAPVALRRWRNVALAAVVLLACGAGWVLTQGEERAPYTGAQPLYDASDVRWQVLEPDWTLPAGEQRGPAVPVGYGTNVRPQGMRIFIGPPRAGLPLDRIQPPRPAAEPDDLEHN